MEAGAAVGAGRQTSFEVYLKREGRWLVQDVFTGRDEALALGQSLAGRKGIEGVRVVRETVEAESGASQELVIFDSGLRLEIPAPRPAPEGRRRPAPEWESIGERGAPVPDPGFPWFSVVSATIGLVIAAVGLWFISAMA